MPRMQVVSQVMEELLAKTQYALTYWWRKAKEYEKRIAELEKELALSREYH